MIAMMMVGIWSQRDDPEAFLYPELLILDCEKNKQTNKTGYFNLKKKHTRKHITTAPETGLLYCIANLR